MPFLAFSILTILFLVLGAQTRPNVVSPDILPNKGVTFRYWAPDAKDVKLSGNWMGSQPPVSLLKSAEGLWSVTIAPLAPNIYAYVFIVDGVRTTDPSCRCAFTASRRFSDSTFTIAGDPPRAWEPQSRPAGTLHHERFLSARQNKTRGFVVYTPPDYDTSRSRTYPVLVLLPGTPGDENDWTSGGGFVEVLFDNLIAAGQMVPMLVVMQASDVLDGQGGRRNDNNLEMFEGILLNEVLPIVKKRYRVKPDPRSWAIGGLSLGGEFGLNVGLRHPEIFRAVASLSGSLNPSDKGEPGRSSFEVRFGPAISAASKRNDQLIWISCGSEDVFLGGAKALAARLEAGKIKYIFREFPGPHAMPAARLQLADLLPLLFRP